MATRRDGAYTPAMDEVSSLADFRMDAIPVVLDLRGLRCPLPVLYTRKALRRLAVGQAVRVLCTDPLAAIDIPNLAREDGHRLVEATRGDGTLAFVVVKQVE